MPSFGPGIPMTELRHSRRRRDLLDGRRTAGSTRVRHLYGLIRLEDGATPGLYQSDGSRHRLQDSPLRNRSETTAPAAKPLQEAGAPAAGAPGVYRDRISALERRVDAEVGPDETVASRTRRWSR